VLLFDQDRQVPARGRQGPLCWSYAHAIRFDKDDNLWAIDKGSDMIVRINPEGHVTMVFGRKKEASDDAEPWKRVTPPLPPVNGSSASDRRRLGHRGQHSTSATATSTRASPSSPRMATLVASIGEPGRTKIGELNTPHTISYDAKGNIYVGDRGNRRIQVIDPKTNTLVREIKIDVPVPPDAKPWMGATPTAEGAARRAARVGESASRRPTPPGSSSSTAPTRFPDAVYKLSVPDGKVLGWLGKSGHQPKQFGWIHENRMPERKTRSSSPSCSIGGCRSSR